MAPIFSKEFLLRVHMSSLITMEFDLRNLEMGCIWNVTMLNHESSNFLYYIVYICCWFAFTILICFYSFFYVSNPLYISSQMYKYLEPLVGYADGASHSTQNLSSAAWAIFSLNDELVSFQGICIGRSTNNITEYSTLIKLLCNAISFGINHIIIRLDSQHVVLQLNSVYIVRNPTLHRLFLRVWLLERHFDFIQYQHISKIWAHWLIH